MSEGGWKEQFDRAVDFIEKGNTFDALDILEGMEITPANEGLVKYSIAVAKARIGRVQDAITLLEDIKEGGSASEAAVTLLEELKKVEDNMKKAPEPAPPAPAPAPAAPQTQSPAAPAPASEKKFTFNFGGSSAQKTQEAPADTADKPKLSFGSSPATPSSPPSPGTPAPEANKPKLSFNFGEAPSAASSQPQKESPVSVPPVHEEKPAVAEKDYFIRKFGPTTLLNCATNIETWREILAFHGSLVSDDYSGFIDQYYRECVEEFGNDWHYLDKLNVLYAAAKLLKPKNYLEIGIGRGRCACAVAEACCGVNIVACDMWLDAQNQPVAGGAELAEQELKKHRHSGAIKFLNGNSHEMLPKLFAANPDVEFDLILVDGDRTPKGVEDDLRTVLPHLSLGGVVVLADVVHPEHRESYGVWKNVINSMGCFLTCEYGELGYGVAFAVRVGK